MTNRALQTMDDTRALALQVAEKLRRGDTVLLSGDLGTGKTTFAQALIETLSTVDPEVTSPTFTLVQQYPVTVAGQESTVFHYDLYRIEQPNALQELGLDDAEPEIRVIEWPQRLSREFAPHSWLSLHFSLNGATREVRVRSGGPLAARMGTP